MLRSGSHVSVIVFNKTRGKGSVMAYLSYTKEFNENLLMLLLRDHKRYLPIVEFFDNVTQGLSELSWAEAELIANEISKANKSEFCNGIRGGMIQALKTDHDILKTDRLAPVLAFAHKVNLDASAVTQGDIQGMMDAGWSEQSVEDVVGLVAIQKLYNTIAAGLGFKGMPTAVFAEIGQDTVDKGGYVASFRSFINS